MNSFFNTFAFVFMCALLGMVVAQSTAPYKVGCVTVTAENSNGSSSAKSAPICSSSCNDVSPYDYIAYQTNTSCVCMLPPSKPLNSSYFTVCASSEYPLYKTFAPFTIGCVASVAGSSANTTTGSATDRIPCAQFCGDSQVYLAISTSAPYTCYCLPPNPTIISGSGCGGLFNAFQAVKVCGDGRTQPPEECDDGNTLANDGCFNCKVEFGATCNNQGAGTATTCTHPTILRGCADSLTPIAKSSTNANVTASITACSSFCNTTYVLLKSGSCVCGTDTANVTSLVTGLTNCTNYAVYITEQICGDGIRSGSEQCDDGNLRSLDGCSASCIVEHNFACIDNNINASKCFPMILEGCTASGGLDAAKSTKASPQVDDLATCGLYCQGNMHMGFELGSSCACSDKRPTVTDCSSGGVDKIYQVQAICGNGILEGEACDDNNTVAGDGCSSTCMVESGYFCYRQPSVCTKYPFPPRLIGCLSDVGLPDPQSTFSPNIDDLRTCLAFCPTSISYIAYTPDSIRENRRCACMPNDNLLIPGNSTSNCTSFGALYQTKVICGDHRIMGNEVCDDGPSGSATCTKTCQFVQAPDPAPAPPSATTSGSATTSSDSTTSGTDSSTVTTSSGATTGTVPATSDARSFVFSALLVAFVLSFSRVCY